MAFHALADYQNHVIGWLQWEQSALGDGAVVRFPRIWMSSGKCRLNDVEAAAKKVNARRGGIGHNHPPEPIDDVAYSREDEAKLFQSTKNIRDAVTSDDTTADHIEEDRKALLRISDKIAKWLAAKADRAANAFASTVGAAASVALVDLLVDLEQKIGGLVRLLEQIF